MPIMQRAMASHCNRLKHYGGVMCDYIGIDGISLTFVMAPARSTTESQTDENILVDLELHDWLCNVTDLPRKPERGDYIKPHGWGRTFRVVHPGGGREYGFMSPWHYSYRIHSVLLEGEDEKLPPPLVPPDPEIPSVPALEGYAPPTDGDVYGSPTGEVYAPPP